MSPPEVFSNSRKHTKVSTESGNKPKKNSKVSMDSQSNITVMWMKQHDTSLTLATALSQC